MTSELIRSGGAARKRYVSLGGLCTVVHNQYGESGKDNDSAIAVVLDFAAQFFGTAPQIYGGDLNEHGAEDLIPFSAAQARWFSAAKIFQQDDTQEHYTFSWNIRQHTKCQWI